jgi:hypothetical protein
VKKLNERDEENSGQRLGAVRSLCSYERTQTTTGRLHKTLGTPYDGVSFPHRSISCFPRLALFRNSLRLYISRWSKWTRPIAPRTFSRQLPCSECPSPDNDNRFSSSFPSAPSFIRLSRTYTSSNSPSTTVRGRTDCKRSNGTIGGTSG